MSNDHRRQKKLERHRRKRQIAQRKAHAETRRTPSTLREQTFRLAAGAPFGPVYVNSSYRDERLGELVTLLVTRQLPGEQVLPGLIVVDRTCLGVKDATLLRPLSRSRIEELREKVARGSGRMEACEPLLAQSIVFHALDYARSLGFQPHRDFTEEILGPRPERLLDTPLARPEKPYFVAGPRDNVPVIMGKLDVAVGRGNYDFMAPVHGLSLASLQDDVWEGDEGDVIDQPDVVR